jgi:hypothetical protein
LASVTDSCLQGDDDTIAQLEARVAQFDVDAWIERRRHQRDRSRPKPVAQPLQKPSQLHNPYQGVPYAWQLSETIENFLERLPPATTDCTEDVPWIFICNPYISRLRKDQGGNQAIKGSEDEAPEQEGSNVDLVLEGGKERLELVRKFVETLNKSKKAASTKEKEARVEQRRASNDILDLAHAAKVRAGKVTNSSLPHFRVCHQTC